MFSAQLPELRSNALARLLESGCSIARVDYARVEVPDDDTALNERLRGTSMEEFLNNHPNIARANKTRKILSMGRNYAKFSDFSVTVQNKDGKQTQYRIADQAAFYTLSNEVSFYDVDEDCIFLKTPYIERVFAEGEQDIDRFCSALYQSVEW